MEGMLTILTAYLTEYLTLFNVMGVVTGALIGGMINLTGVGGGVLVIPVLAVGFALPPVVAVGTASLYATLTKLLSSWYHVRSGLIDWRVVGAFLVGAIPITLGVSGGVVYALQAYPEYQAQIQEWIKYVIIVVMMAAVAGMVYQTKRTSNRPMNRAYLVMGGMLTGVIMGLTGIGGGVLIIPLLVWLTQASIKRIISCSIVIAVIISALSGLVYSQGGQYHLTLLIGLLLGSSIGIKISDGLRHRLSETQLTRIVIGLIVLSAFVMLFR